MRILFLVNPRSGPRRDRERLQDAIHSEARRLALDFEVVLSQSKEELEDILQTAEKSGVDVVCAVGGDGTVSEIGKRLIGRGMALAVLPLGSGNGFARHLGIDLDPMKALRGIPGGRIERIDTGRVNGVPFLGVCGIGFDAVVAHRFASSSVRGLRTYLREGVIGYVTYRDEEVDLIVSNNRRHGGAFVLAVANSSQYGNDARIAPLASLQDGLLDVCIVRRFPLLAAPFILRSLFQGTLNRSRYVECMKVSAITVERTREGPAHIDGEPLILPSTLAFEVAPRSLSVLVPASTGRL
jgi:diacylglycerol kinase (ATP)